MRGRRSLHQLALYRVAPISGRSSGPSDTEHEPWAVRISASRAGSLARRAISRCCASVSRPLRDVARGDCMRIFSVKVHEPSGAIVHTDDVGSKPPPPVIVIGGRVTAGDPVRVGSGWPGPQPAM